MSDSITTEQNPPLWIARMLLAGAAGGKVFAFSAETGVWTELAPALDASHELRVGTNLAVVEQRDAGRVHAHSSLTGEHAVLAAPLQDAVVQAAANVALVASGTAAHAFSAAVRKDGWSPAPLTWAAEPANARVSANVALVTERTTDANGNSRRRLHGFSALAGTWAAPVEVDAGGGAVFVADGNLGMAITPAGAHGFSALTSTWTTLPIASLDPSVAMDTNLLMVRTPGWTAVHAFSGVTGGWSSQPLPANPSPVPVWAAGGNTGLVEVWTSSTAGRLYLYSAVRNAWLNTDLKPGDRYAMETATSS